MAQLYKQTDTTLFNCQGAILDCDGTLIDSLKAWKGVEQYLMSFTSGSLNDKDHALLTTLTIPEIGNFFFERFGIGGSSEGVIEIINEYMLDFYSTKSALLPGVAEFLEASARAGVRMCIASSSPQAYLVAGAKNTGIAEYFTEIISVDDLKTTKREPKVFDYAQQILGTEKAVTWGFEDSLYAIDTLSRAGFKTVGIYDAHEGKSFEYWEQVTSMAVSSFEELSIE